MTSACRLWRAMAQCTFLGLLAGCSTVYQDSSPELAYSRNAEAARSLQVPPDLTDVSDVEQFIVPGSDGDAVTRDTLLPTFDGVRRVRAGARSWLEFANPPEELWSRLLAFARDEKYRIEATEPTAGTIYTQWRPASAVRDSSLLSGLLGGEEYTRLGFRLERGTGAGVGTRLFVRRQSADEDAVAEGATVAWPADAEPTDADDEMLARLLVFLGVEEQQAKGLLDTAAATRARDDVVVSSAAAGSLLLVHRGFEPSFRALQRALESLEREITSSDDGVGRIEYLEGDATLVLTLSPVHVSAVRVSVSESDGRRLVSSRERKALEQLRDALLA